MPSLALKRLLNLPWNMPRFLQDNDFHEFKISVKASDVFLAVAAYQQLADVIDCPLHIGITEAGGLRAGTNQIGHWSWQSALGRYWRYGKSVFIGRPDRRGESRL
jgi:hypothetical protein